MDEQTNVQKIYKENCQNGQVDISTKRKTGQNGKEIKKERKGIYYISLSFSI